MRKIKKGSTNISVELYIIDSSDGTPELSVVFNSSGIDLNYRRDGAVVVGIDEAVLTTPLLTDSHEDGGFLAVANGRYRLDVPDAAFLTGASQVTIGGTVTGMVVLPITIQLVNFDPDDGVRMGLTALPDAAADGVLGLPISDAGGLDMDGIKAVIDLLPNAGALSDLATILSDTGEMQPKIVSIETDVTAILMDTQTTLENHLTDIKGTGFVKDTHSLVDIEAYVDLMDDGTSGLAKIATDVALVLADTNELQTDWLDGGRLDLIIDDILADTAVIGAAGAGLTGLGGMSSTMKSQINTEVDTAFTTQMADSVPADGTISTREQALYALLQIITEFAISGTTMTVKKVDGSTTLMTFTLDDGTSPTSLTRAT